MEITKIQKSGTFFMYITKEECFKLGIEQGDHVRKEIVDGKLVVSKV